MRRTCVFLAALACAALAGAAEASVLAAFTVLGPEGTVARAVVEGERCPALAVDGAGVTMSVRAPADERFPLVCEAVLPTGAATATLDGAALPLPHAEVKRIAIFGDSGCRVDAPAHEYQACNDPAAWPFLRTSAAAAALMPDLVIHVGDYLYRESPCPALQPGCRGSPSGDDWAAWQADFFAPAATLLKAAPWVMVRGNHENCSRSGAGFFRLLDPRPLPASCPFISPVYRVAVGGLTFYVLDSGEAGDVTAPPQLVDTYRQNLAAIDGPAWLLTHRPVWAVARFVKGPGLSVLLNFNATLSAAMGDKPPAAIALVVSGHIHLFEALSFADHRAPQLVLGTAGSSLSDDIGEDLAGHGIAGTAIAYGRTTHEFGVTTMERAGDGWAATLRDEAGAPRFTCTIVGSAVRCEP